MEKITLAEVIAADDKSQYSDFISEQLKKHPYSQPIQRLAALAGLSSEFPIHRYNWKQSLKSNTETQGTNEVISLAVTDLSLKKPKPPKQARSKQGSLAPVTQNGTQKLSSSAKALPLSPFTQWLNSKTEDLAGTGRSSEIVTTNQPSITKPYPPETKLKTKVKKQKKSKKAKKKKSLLKQKIEASVERNEEIMTETLAKLYMDQGYYKRALALYEQLSLKYPEKSSFFAPFIADIKSKLQ